MPSRTIERPAVRADIRKAPSSDINRIVLDLKNGTVDGRMVLDLVATES